MAQEYATAQAATVRGHASLFDSLACRRAVEEANVSSWRRLCSTNWPHALCNGGQVQFAWGACSISNCTRGGVTYVRNQKAGSTMLTEGFLRLFGVNAPRGQRHHEGTKPVLRRTLEAGWVFTFVRDPFQTALSGYLEMRHHARPSQVNEMFEKRELKRGNPGDRAIAQGYIEHAEVMARLFDSGNGSRSCNGAQDATEQFVRFLVALTRKQSLSMDIFHVFPQALKINHVQPSNSSAPHFDGIGKVESFDEDLSQMRSMIGHREGSDESNASALQLERHKQSTAHRTNHSHRQPLDSCARVDSTDPRVQALVCKLYAVDYACFDYDRSWCRRRARSLEPETEDVQAQPQAARAAPAADGGRRARGS